MLSRSRQANVNVYILHSDHDIDSNVNNNVNNHQNSHDQDLANYNQIGLSREGSNVMFS